jgi:hypothetical protein
MDGTEMTDIIIEKCPPTECKFLAFTDCEWDEAVKAFKKRYGVNPANVIRWKKLVYAGPVPDNFTPTFKENEND